MDRNISSGTLLRTLFFRTPLRNKNCRIAERGMDAIFAPRFLRCFRVAETGFISMEMERSEKCRFFVPPGTLIFVSISGAVAETTSFGFLYVSASFFLGRIFAGACRFPFIFTAPPTVGVTGAGIVAGDNDEKDV